MAVGLKTSSWDGCNVHGMDEKFMGWLHVVAGKFMGWMNVHWVTVCMVTGNSMGWMNPVVEMRGGGRPVATGGEGG